MYSKKITGNKKHPPLKKPKTKQNKKDKKQNKPRFPGN